MPLTWQLACSVLHPVPPKFTSRSPIEHPLIFSDVAFSKRQLLFDIAAKPTAGFKGTASFIALAADGIPSVLETLPFVMAARCGALATHDLLNVQLLENVARTSDKIQTLRDIVISSVTSFFDGLQASVGDVCATKGLALQESLV